MNALDWLQPLGEPDGGFTVLLSLTLFHFLWQGCIISAVVYANGWVLRRSPATVRYWLHVGALLLMVACVSVTFTIVSMSQNKTLANSALASESTSSNLADATIVVGLEVDPPIVRPESDLPTDVLDRADLRAEGLGSLSETDQSIDVAVIEEEKADSPASAIAGISPWLTVFYFTGLAVMLFRLTRSLRRGHRLKRESTVVDDEALLVMVKRQAGRVGLKTAPAVALCSRVTVLTVIGVIKPVILLPASLAMGLAPQQLEALLAHELAHIRRFDLVVNLLQRLVEALLFFHPAVWFVSRRVSIERERACDDTVVAAGWQRVNYADALVRMAELSSSPHNSQFADQVTAVAASGGKPSDLKRRVLRLLGHDDLPKVRLTQAGLTMFVVVLTLAVLAPLLVRAWAQSDGARPTGDETERAADLAASDTEVPRSESEQGKPPRPEMGDGRGIVPETNRLPNEQKLSGKWYGEKEGIKVWLTFHSPVEARWKVYTGRARIGVSFRNVIDEEAGVINLWFDYKWVTGDKKGQSGSQVLGQVRDGARDTLLLNILPTDLYQPSDRYRPVKDIVLNRAVSKDGDEPKIDRRSDIPGSREPSVREEQRAPDADQQLIETIDAIRIFECRKIIQKFDDAGKIRRACEARERLANRLERITQQPFESFTRPIRPDPNRAGLPSEDGGDGVGIQIHLDGVWSTGHGTAADWKDSIIRKQKRYRTDRRRLFFQAGQAYRKMGDLESAKRILQAGLKGSEVYDEPVEKLISKYWPVSDDEGARSLGSDSRAWVIIGFLRELASVLRDLGDLDGAIAVQTRLMLAHFSAEWDQPSAGPTRRARELWQMIREKRGPLPPLFWFNVLDEENPSITFDLSSARQKGSILQFHDQNVTATPTHDFDELKVTAEFHGKGGFIDCYMIPGGGQAVSLGSIGFNRPGSDAAQTVSKTIKAPANTGLIQFAVRGTEERVGKVTVEATFRKRADAKKPRPSQKSGTLTGRFLYDGEPPKPEKISIGTERRTRDGRLLGPSPRLVRYSRLGLTDQSLIVGKDNGIKNIAVWIRSKDVPVPPRTEPGEKPVLRASGGRFEPRLLVFQAPHTLVLNNEETNVVNFHWAPLGSVPFNRLVRAQQRVEHAIERPSVLPGSVKSNYHPWMKSWLFPCKHPYFAASADDGTFRIENLPLGEWEFWVWHERTAYLKTDHWPKGRFTLKIEAGTNDLGDVKLHADLFEEKDEGESAAKQGTADSEEAKDPQPSQKLGTLTGRFIYDGEPPKPEKISISTERRSKDNRSVWTDSQLVHYSRLGLMDQSLIVGKDRGIKNIVVWIRNRDVPIPPRTEAGEKPVLRATGGQFEPRLLVFQAPRTLVLKNEETEETNVVNFHWHSLASVPFNRVVPTQQTVEHTIERPDVFPGPVKSNYHPWMKSWLFPCRHPYFATSADDGTFRIENLPLGEWEFWVWHERTGRLKTDHWPKGRDTLKIDAGANDLGVVKLDPGLFEEKDEGEKAGQPDNTADRELDKPRTGQIDGQLADTKGEAVSVAGAVVFLCDAKTGYPVLATTKKPLDPDSPQKNWIREVWHAVTDERGGFEFKGVPLGHYRLVAQSWLGTEGIPWLDPEPRREPFGDTSPNVRIDGIAEGIALTSETPVRVTVRKLGNGVLRIVNDPKEANAFLLVSRQRPFGDPVLGPEAWGEKFFAKLIAITHMSEPYVVFSGLPDGQDVHVGLVNYDNSVGVGGGSYRVGQKREVSLRILAGWSNGHYDPPDRLLKLVEHFEEHSLSVSKLIGLELTDAHNYKELRRILAEDPNRLVDVDGLGKLPFVDLLAASSYKELRASHRARRERRTRITP